MDIDKDETKDSRCKNSGGANFEAINLDEDLHIVEHRTEGNVSLARRAMTGGHLHMEQSVSFAYTCLWSHKWGSWAARASSAWSDECSVTPHSPVELCWSSRKHQRAVSTDLSVSLEWLLRQGLQSVEDRGDLGAGYFAYRCLAHVFVACSLSWAYRIYFWSDPGTPIRSSAREDLGIC